MSKEIKQAITVKLPLRTPTKRKEKRLQKALEESHTVAQIASNRMMGVPRRNWRAKSPKNSWWWSWSKELGEDEVDLPTETIHQIIQAVRETYCSWQSHGYRGKRPKFKKWNRIQYRGQGKQAKYYRQGLKKWFLSLPMEAGRGQRETFPLITSDYHQNILEQIENGLAKAADGGELIHKDDGTYWFHQPVVYTQKIPETEELDNIVAVKLARWELVTAALYNLNEDSDKKYEKPEWIKFLQSGREIEHHRRRIHDKRSRLMKRGQLKKVKQLRNHEAKYVENILHTVSRRIVTLAQQAPGKTGIVLEDMTYATQNFMQQERRNKRAVTSWPFADTITKIEYKALKAGVPVYKVSPVRSSRWCSKCGKKAEQKGPEHWRPDFHCKHCDYKSSPRYVNATRNVAKRFGQKHLNEDIHYQDEQEPQKTPA